MILYNVTVSVDSDVEQEWVLWMKTIHIPEVMETGFFFKHRMLKLLNEGPDDTGATYAVQYEAENIGQLDEYLTRHAPSLQHEHMTKFGQKSMAFRTVLEEI